MMYVLPPSLVENTYQFQWLFGVRESSLGCHSSDMEAGSRPFWCKDAEIVYGGGLIIRLMQTLVREQK